MPQITNYVDLDPSVVDVWGQPVPRITYQNHPYEIAAAAYCMPKTVEIMEASVLARRKRNAASPITEPRVATGAVRGQCD